MAHYTEDMRLTPQAVLWPSKATAAPSMVTLESPSTMGKASLASGANGHISDAGNFFAHVRGAVGGNDLAAVACGVTEADNAFPCFF